MTAQHFGGDNPEYIASMQEASDALRDRILAMLAEREGRFAAKVRGHEQARQAIAKGIDREKVQSLFALSDTAYEQLAGQVRAGLR